MKNLSIAVKRFGLILSLAVLCQTNSFATIPGVTGTSFNLTASSANIPTPDGNSVHMWGYGVSGSAMQYPGPTLIVNEGDAITINLTNGNIPKLIAFVNRADTHISVRESDQTEEALNMIDSLKVLHYRICQRTMFRRTLSEGLSIFELAPASKSAGEFERFARALYPELT